MFIRNVLHSLDHRTVPPMEQHSLSCRDARSTRCLTIQVLFAIAEQWCPDAQSVTFKIFHKYSSPPLPLLWSGYLKRSRRRGIRVLTSLHLPRNVSFMSLQYGMRGENLHVAVSVPPSALQRE